MPYNSADVPFRLIGKDERKMFSEKTEAELRAQAAVFAAMLIALIPGYDFWSSALATKYLKCEATAKSASSENAASGRS
jgi:hypothetical protein